MEQLQNDASAPSVKQRLAAVRMLFGWLVTGQVMPTNPASDVRGPKRAVKAGKMPVFEGAPSRSPLLLRPIKNFHRALANRVSQPLSRSSHSLAPGNSSA